MHRLRVSVAGGPVFAGGLLAEVHSVFAVRWGGCPVLGPAERAAAAAWALRSLISECGCLSLLVT